MLNKLVEFIDACIALATELRAKNAALATENSSLKAQIAAAEKQTADAEAKAEQLKEQLTTFASSGN